MSWLLWRSQPNSFFPFGIDIKMLARGQCWWISSLNVRLEGRLSRNNYFTFLQLFTQFSFLETFNICLLQIMTGLWPIFIDLYNDFDSSIRHTDVGDISVVNVVCCGESRISPRWGHQLSRGTNIRFCQIFPKTAWNWKNLDPWGLRHLDPPPASVKGSYFGGFLMTHSYIQTLL